MTEPYLTEQEANELPNGSLVRVTWSGGNGPHTYEVGRDDRGNLFLQSPGKPLTNYRHSLRFVGAEDCHTRVQKIETKDA